MKRQEVLEILKNSDFTRAELNDAMIEAVEAGMLALVHLQDGNTDALHKDVYGWFFRNSSVLSPLIQQYASELPEETEKAAD